MNKLLSLAVVASIMGGAFAVGAYAADDAAKTDKKATKAADKKDTKAIDAAAKGDKKTTKDNKATAKSDKKETKKDAKAATK